MHDFTPGKNYDKLINTKVPRIITVFVLKFTLTSVQKFIVIMSQTRTSTKQVNVLYNIRNIFIHK